jgi:hypothetical protein
MHFKIVGAIAKIEVIASCTAIRERKRLWTSYGKGRCGARGAEIATLSSIPSLRSARREFVIPTERVLCATEESAVVWVARQGTLTQI